MDQSDILREQLIKLLEWEDAHVNFDAAVEKVPMPLQGVRPEGLPYSPWELLEHLRLTQNDILNFCRNPNYKPPKWPEEYWPKTTSPPAPNDWEKSIDGFLADRHSLQSLIADPTFDLYAKIRHGDGQTYLREVLLVADHSAYHVGELVAVRRLLGIWK